MTLPALRRRLDRFLPLMLWLVAWVSPTFGSMGEPPTLRELIESADAIAVVRTVQDTASPLPHGTLGRPSNAYAVLAVEELIHCRVGKPASFKIEYSDNIICPPPPGFILGQVELAFMTASGQGWSLMFAGRRRFESREAMEVFVGQVRKYLRILDVSDSPSRETATIDWLVDSACLDSSRPDALRELAPVEIVIGETGPFAKRVTNSHLERIGRSLLEHWGPNASDWDIAGLALLMQLRRHQGGVKSILKWLAVCRSAPSVGTFGMIVKASAKLIGRPKLGAHFVKQYALTRIAEESPWEPIGWFTVTRRRVIAGQCADRLCRSD